jgi:2,4-dienoyl-CoA reductase-like NADH-dependent reductase (Old Yellow Enzyme family)
VSLLLSPLTLRGTTLRNRIAVSPMCQYSSVDGMPGDWHLVHLGARAVGGAGLVLTEAAAVSPEGRISPEDAGLWNDAQAEAWARVVAFVRAQGAAAGVQLAHAGRKASTYRPWHSRRGSVPLDDGGWESVGPSAVAFGRYAAPRELDEAGIAKVVADFVASTRRADDAGFDVVEIHGAHGYLLHSFCSPLSNQRTDSWGGSFSGRIRLPLAVADAVRAVWPDHKPLLYRVSAQDWVEGGWTLEETVELALLLAERGVDLVDCSSGGLAPEQDIDVHPGYQVPFARAVRDAGVPSGAVGMLTDAQQCEQVLADGDADLVLLARELLRDPHWPLRAAHELDAEGPWPAQYERARW